jgi:hypothetical protein
VLSKARFDLYQGGLMAKKIRLRRLKQSALDTPEQVVARESVFWAGFAGKVSPHVVTKGIPRFLDWATTIRKNIWIMTRRLRPEDREICEQRWRKCEECVENLLEADKHIREGKPPFMTVCLLSMGYLEGEMRGLYASLQETFPEFVPKKEKS